MLLISGFLLVLAMTWVSRMSGGAWPKLPLGLDQWVYSLPYLALLFPVAGPWAFLAYAGAVAGKRMGHGSFMDLGHRPDKGKPERIEGAFKWLRGRVSVFWYEMVCLSASGLLVTLLPAAMLILHGYFLACMALLVSGAMKGLAYAIGWAVYPSGEGRGIPELREATQIGEALTGLFAGLGIVAAAFCIPVIRLFLLG